ncbi:MAG: M48 family metallopeptidase [Eubacterium sp.]
MKYKAEKVKEYKINEISFTLIKSKRKTLCAYVQPDQSVIVKAPVSMKDRDILDWVYTKINWITRKQLEIQQRPVKKYVEGEKFQFLGEDYPLHIVYDEKNGKIRVNIVRNKLTVYTNTRDKERIKRVIRKWYIENAKKYFFNRVNYYHNKYIREPMKCIYIKEQKTCWGSCSSLGNLNFNWKAIMAPPRVIDYIVVHEMCHLKYMNHSKQFWSAVEKILPDYQEQKKWLRVNGKNLDL